MDDEALIARIAAGDSDAMAEFQGRWFRQFVRLATKLTGNPDAAEDIAMDTVVRVITKARSYRAGLKPRSWLLAILYNRARDWARRAGVRWAYSLSGPSDDEDGGPRAAEIPDREPSAEEKLIARERADAMRAALERLTAAERAVILLRDYSGLSAPEAAVELEISVEKVGSRLFRARRRLGALLQTDWPGLFPAHEL